MGQGGHGAFHDSYSGRRTGGAKMGDRTRAVPPRAAGGDSRSGRAAPAGHGRVVQEQSCDGGILATRERPAGQNRGFFVRANDINTIMLSVARTHDETRHVIFHEAAHWHLNAREGPMPLWLGEGLAEVYATFELPDSKTYAFGAAFQEHVARLQNESLLPLPKLLGIGRDSLLYNEGTRTSIFYAQSWALVHFLFYGEKSPGRAAVQRYLELLPVVRSADDAFSPPLAPTTRRSRSNCAGTSRMVVITNTSTRGRPVILRVN